MKTSVRKLVSNAVLAAVYAAVTYLFSWCSYGTVQFRVSEALCVLPFFIPSSAWGLFVGCIVANLISPAGIADMVFGSLATLGAEFCIVRGRTLFRGSVWAGRIFTCLMPVLWNGAVVGAVLMFAAGAPSLSVFALFGGEVALGEAAVMFLLGLPLMLALPRVAPFRQLERIYEQ